MSSKDLFLFVFFSLMFLVIQREPTVSIAYALTQAIVYCK